MVYVSNYHISMRFFFSKATLLWSESKKAVTLTGQCGEAYLAENGTLFFATPVGTIATPVVNAMRCGKILTVQSKSSHWVFELGGVSV